MLLSSTFSSRSLGTLLPFFSGENESLKNILEKNGICVLECEWGTEAIEDSFLLYLLTFDGSKKLFLCLL